MALQLTGDSAADEILDRDPFSLVVGMLLDHSITWRHQSKIF